MMFLLITHESWGWVINDNIFFFGWTIPLNYTEIQNKEYSFIEYSHNVCFLIATYMNDIIP